MDIFNRNHISNVTIVRRIEHLKKTKMFIDKSICDQNVNNARGLYVSFPSELSVGKIYTIKLKQFNI